MSPGVHDEEAALCCTLAARPLRTEGGECPATAYHRSQVVLWRDRDCRRTDIARRAVSFLSEALQGHAQYLVEKGGRAVQRGASHERGSYAAHPGVFLEPGFEVHSLFSGRGR